VAFCQITLTTCCRIAQRSIRSQKVSRNFLLVLLLMTGWSGGPSCSIAAAKHQIRVLLYVDLCYEDNIIMRAIVLYSFLLIIIGNCISWNLRICTLLDVCYWIAFSCHFVTRYSYIHTVQCFFGNKKMPICMSEALRPRALSWFSQNLLHWHVLSRKSAAYIDTYVNL